MRAMASISLVTPVWVTTKATIFRLREGGMHELHVRIHDEVAADGGAQKLLVSVERYDCRFAATVERDDARAR
mgnify:CR=1 FL=1